LSRAPVQPVVQTPTERFINAITALVENEISSNRSNTPEPPATPERQVTSLVPTTVELASISEAQLNEPILLQIGLATEECNLTDSAAKTLHSRVHDIYEINDVLYIKDHGRDKIILPPSLHDTILEHYHDAPFAGHVGIQRTYERIQRNYYWLNLMSIVTEYIKRCRDCAMFKPSTVNTTPPLLPITTTYPFALVEMDVVGPSSVTERGNLYLLTMIDHFTRWPEAYPIPDQTTETVLNCLEDFISRHGVPDRILTDQGTNFTSHLFTSFCQSFDIGKKTTTSYHPAANGQVEKLNSTLVKIIRHYVASNQRDWDTWVPASLHSYRTSVQASTKKTLFELLHARKNKMPLDLLNPNTEKATTPTTYLHNARTRLRDAYATVRQNQQTAQDRQKANYDRNASDLVFEVGDRVWLNNKARKVGLNPKLQPKWNGPFTVLERRGVDYVIKADDNKKSCCSSATPQAMLHR
jgi:transposase InsO family protein